MTVEFSLAVILQIIKVLSAVIVKDAAKMILDPMMLMSKIQ